MLLSPGNCLLNKTPSVKKFRQAVGKIQCMGLNSYNSVHLTYLSRPYKTLYFFEIILNLDHRGYFDLCVNCFHKKVNIYK